LPELEADPVGAFLKAEHATDLSMIAQKIRGRGVYLRLFNSK
jgi:hypothetical protein